MSYTCYIFSPSLLILSFSQVATNFTFISGTSLILLLLKCLPSNATEKFFIETAEHTQEEFFLIYYFSQDATNFKFTSEMSLILLLIKCLPSNATKKLFVKIAEHKLEEFFMTTYKEMFNWDTSFYSVSQLLTNLPDLPLFTSSGFSNSQRCVET